MDGIEAVKKIRSIGSPEAVKLPIPAMTADAFGKDRDGSGGVFRVTPTRFPLRAAERDLPR